MAEQMEATIELINDKVRFTGAMRSNPAITLDYFPPIGDGEGYTGLELLLMSFAGCSATAIVTLIRKMRKTVAGFAVNAKGIRREQMPTSFETISLEFVLRSPDAEHADMQKAIRLAEETYCPVWAMLRNNVTVTTDFKILAP